MFLGENKARGLLVILFIWLPTFIVPGYGNCGAPPRLDFAILEDKFIGQNDFPLDANVTYACLPGYIRNTNVKNIILCLSDSTWSTAETFCQPQSCTPPYPITDGSYDPVKDEYTYEDAVTYQCNGKKYVLKGESSIYCNADGDWNSDPPECIDVECPNPEVENAKKVTGFIGPYYHKSAVTFECSSGFTMKGFNFVTCNLNKQWNPPLPTCSKGNVAAAMGHGIFILTMILLGHVINPHF